MLRGRLLQSALLHRGVSCSPSPWRAPPHQFHSFAALGRRASSKCWPRFLELTYHIPVKQFVIVGGLAAATAVATLSNGCWDTALCQEIRNDVPLSEDRGTDWDEDRASVLLWMRRLWVPFLLVMTVAMGWHYPLSLGVNVIFLLVSTKPTPASIYIWIEQKRLQAAHHGMHGVKRFKTQLSNASRMMHVEVQDYGVACLARVSSLTQRKLVIGVLGDWWLLYSSSSSISGFNLGSWFPLSSLSDFVEGKWGLNS